jgi:hypothetical protein
MFKTLLRSILTVLFVLAPMLATARVNLPANHPVTTTAANIGELGKRISNWKARPHLYCDNNGKHFPSKMKSPPSWVCDDGDMTLFNGLLCLSGEDDGCKAVRDSQDRDGDGSWWRSPLKMHHPDTSSPSNPNHQTSFNSDQSLGVYAYLTQTGDRVAFEKRLDRIKNNGFCTHVTTKEAFLLKIRSIAEMYGLNFG